MGYEGGMRGGALLVAHWFALISNLMVSLLRRMRACAMSREGERRERQRAAAVLAPHTWLLMRCR